ncbi:stage iv sporulation pro-sigma-k processing enzyme (spoivfb) [hydrocarbon metagenome]|uniref:Stage iv sporulation pro-sigma-k processing enzyme (Spoivfb) n=1 Tax=hydrocarbon metagenome TaxID=938273 RepID=A0A0W8E707_9ZZZZ
MITTAVLLHEAAHIMVAVNLGVKISEVELLPFGGQAKAEDFTGLEPEKEIYVAMAGPLISLAMAAVCFFLLPEQGPLTRLFINLNLFLGSFNLLPALPLDGGRMVRAVLSRRAGYRKATLATAFTGKVIAVLALGGGIYLTYTDMSGANLIIIGFLLYWAASKEKKLLAFAFMRFLVNKKSQLTRHGFMECQQIVAAPDTLVKKILDSSRPSYYLTVLIIGHDESVRGILTEAELIECLLEKGPAACIKDC